MKKFQDNVIKLIKLLHGNKKIKSIYLIGSINVATSDNFSDIDFIVTVTHQLRRSERLRHYLQCLNDIEIETFDLKSWEFGTSDSFFSGKNNICIMYYTEDELKNKVDHIIKSNGIRHGFYIPTGFLSAVLNSSKIGPNGEKLKRNGFESLGVYPENLRKKIIDYADLMIQYFLRKLDVALIRGDQFHAEQCFIEIRDQIISKIFALAKIYRNSDKRLLLQLKSCSGEIDPTLLKTAIHLVTVSDISSENLRRIYLILMSKLSITPQKDLIYHIEKKYHGH